MSEHVREFTCMDCGVHVTQFMPLAANDQHVCVECTFLRTIEDPMERAAMRKLLQPERK